VFINCVRPNGSKVVPNGSNRVELWCQIGFTVGKVGRQCSSDTRSKWVGTGVERIGATLDSSVPAGSTTVPHLIAIGLNYVHVAACRAIAGCI
jgi:hypothetical protein